MSKAQDSAKCLKQIETLRNYLDDNFDRFYTTAQDAAQKKLVRDNFKMAEDAYWLAISNGLSDPNALVMDLAKELKVINDDLRTNQQDLANLATTLAQIKQAVLLAASIAALAA